VLHAVDPLSIGESETLGSFSDILMYMTLVALSCSFSLNEKDVENRQSIVAVRDHDKDTQNQCG